MKVPQRKKLRGTCHGLNHRIMINPKYDNSDIFNTMHHEFRHAKQHELASNIDPTTVFRGNSVPVLNSGQEYPNNKLLLSDTNQSLKFFKLKS